MAVATSLTIVPDSPDPGIQTPIEADSGQAVHRTLIESSADHAIFMLDAQGRIVSWSAPARALYGYEEATIRNEPLETLFAGDEDGRSDPNLGDVLAAARTEPQTVGHWHKRADGTIFWGSLSLSPLIDEPFDGYAVVCEDRTEKKEYERMLERQNDRLKEFTDIIAHDLRNPLNLIDGRLRLFQETGNHEHIEVIKETRDRMARLVDDLLSVARQGMIVDAPVSTDLQAVTVTAWEAIAATGNSTLQYEAVRPISADPDRLCELLENLLRNAVEHGRSDVTVRVGPLERGFYVEDDGPGIDEDLREEVFNHGVSTVPDGHGYGLSIVRTIVNAHGWDVRVTESDSGGARFEITGIEFVG